LQRKHFKFMTLRLLYRIILLQISKRKEKKKTIETTENLNKGFWENMLSHVLFDVWCDSVYMEHFESQKRWLTLVLFEKNWPLEK
jgi:hypothetical protein